MAPCRGNTTKRARGGPNCKSSSSMDSQNWCCGTCGTAIDSKYYGCDSCPLVFHDTSLCMGLPKSAMRALKHGASVRYHCTGCRAKRDADAEGEGGGGAVLQLHETVKSLCATVKELERKVTLMDCEDNTDSVSVFPSLKVWPELDPAVRKQIIEAEERRKRKESVIIRGIQSETLEEAKEKVAEVTSIVLGSPLPLSNLFCINPGHGIYRVECPDVELINSLVEQGSVLQSTEGYKNIYVYKYLRSSTA